MTNKGALVSLVEIADDAILPATEYDGKTRPARQHAYLHQMLKYPVPFTLAVPDAGPYKPGMYFIGGNCFRPGQYGLDFVGKELVLIPADPQQLDELKKRISSQ